MYFHYSVLQVFIGAGLNQGLNGGTCNYGELKTNRYAPQSSNATFHKLSDYFTKAKGCFSSDEIVGWGEDSSVQNLKQGFWINGNYFKKFKLITSSN